MKFYRRITLFEITLLIVGLFVGVVGFMMINSIYNENPVISWELFQTIFLWLILIVLLVLTATMTDVKEELAVVIKEHITETKVIQEIDQKQLDEMKKRKP